MRTRTSHQGCRETRPPRRRRPPTAPGSKGGRCRGRLARGGGRRRRRGSDARSACVAGTKRELGRSGPVSLFPRGGPAQHSSPAPLPRPMCLLAALSAAVRHASRCDGRRLYIGRAALAGWLAGSQLSAAGRRGQQARGRAQQRWGGAGAASTQPARLAAQRPPHTCVSFIAVTSNAPPCAGSFSAGGRRQAGGTHARRGQRVEAWTRPAAAVGARVQAPPAQFRLRSKLCPPLTPDGRLKRLGAGLQAELVVGAWRPLEGGRQAGRQRGQEGGR